MTGSWIVAKSPRTVHLILEKALYLFLVPSHHSISVFLSLCQFSNILFLIMKCRSYLKVIPSSSCLTARSSPLYICARAHTHTLFPPVSLIFLTFGLKPAVIFTSDSLLVISLGEQTCQVLTDTEDHTHAHSMELCAHNYSSASSSFSVCCVYLYLKKPVW